MFRLSTGRTETCVRRIKTGFSCILHPRARAYGRPPPCASFPDSAAASVTIGELGDYSDPATGLEHHLAVGCTSDAEKEAMRKAVLVALAKIGNQELEALSQAFREDTQRYIKERGG